MKIKLLFILSLTYCVHFFSQSTYVMGNVSNENGDKLPNTTVINLSTDQIVVSDFMGNFVISGKPSDEIRFVRQGYERKLLILNQINFTKSLNIRLETIIKEIEEVKLTFRPTGNLKKDISKLNPPAKVTSLNMAINSYMKTQPTEVYGKPSIPSSFKHPDFSVGQVDLFKLTAAVVGITKKTIQPTKTAANYLEIQEFYRRIKKIIDIKYFINQGIDEYDFDIFLAYADEAKQLSKNYRNNFNKVAIESSLRLAFKDYITTRNFSKKVSGS